MSKSEYRLGELKKEHRKNKIKPNKYALWLRKSFAITEYNPGKYRIEGQLKKLTSQ